eukprot:Hpha_TRINITY_DN15865_c3_g1::TRINITY_DN15865_c3_g1_i3::g.188324::m.188324
MLGPVGQIMGGRTTPPGMGGRTTPPGMLGGVGTQGLLQRQNTPPKVMLGPGRLGPGTPPEAEALRVKTPGNTPPIAGLQPHQQQMGMVTVGQQLGYTPPTLLGPAHVPQPNALNPPRSPPGGRGRSTPPSPKLMQPGGRISPRTMGLTAGGTATFGAAHLGASGSSQPGGRNTPPGGRMRGPSGGPLGGGGGFALDHGVAPPVRGGPPGARSRATSFGKPDLGGSTAAPPVAGVFVSAQHNIQGGNQGWGPGNPPTAM